MCKYRQPQPKPRCLGSDLCSDKLEHILLSKDVILLLTVIFSVGLLGGSLCDVAVFTQSDSEKGPLTQQEKCDTDDLCFYLVSLIMFYRMFIKVLNWQDAGRYRP